MALFIQRKEWLLYLLFNNVLFKSSEDPEEDTKGRKNNAVISIYHED